MSYPGELMLVLRVWMQAGFLSAALTWKWAQERTKGKLTCIIDRQVGQSFIQPANGVAQSFGCRSRPIQDCCCHRSSCHRLLKHSAWHLQINGQQVNLICSSKKKDFTTVKTFFLLSVWLPIGWLQIQIILKTLNILGSIVPNYCGECVHYGTMNMLLLCKFFST